MNDDRATIQNIMRLGWDTYKCLHSLPKYVLAAVSALLSCRTAALGGHVQSCPDGHFHRHWYNSCKHRLCPQCAYILIERWLQKQKARLLCTDHYHAIFTLPHELNDIWLQNIKVMTGLLFRAVRDTLFDFIEDEKHVGGIPGMIASLHTWSQTLILHPHIHCLITGGGLDSSGKWRKPKRDTFLPYKAVMIKYRGKMLDYINIAIRKKEITLPKNMSPQQWINLRNRLGRKVKWNVNFRERYKGGQGVVTYLARYLRGGPISNHRIISCDKGVVRFSFRMNGSTSGKKSIMTLSIGEFIQRYLLHVPVPYVKRVRSYGLYASGNKDKLDECRKMFGQLPAADMEFITWQAYCEKRGEEHPEQCPVCGKRLVILETIPRLKDRESKFIPLGGQATVYSAAA
jgi:hypothetical protein